MREARHKRPHAVWFCLCEMSRAGKPMDTESTLAVIRRGAGGAVGNGEWLLMGRSFPIVRRVWQTCHLPSLQNRADTSPAQGTAASETRPWNGCELAKMGEGVEKGQPRSYTLCTAITPSSALGQGPLPWSPGATVDASMLPRTPVLKPGCRFQKSWHPPHTQESVLIRLGGAEEPRLCFVFLQHFIVKNVQPIEKWLK